MGELLNHQNSGLIFQRVDAVGFIGCQAHHWQAVGFGFLFWW